MLTRNENTALLINLISKATDRAHTDIAGELYSTLDDFKWYLGYNTRCDDCGRINNECICI